MLPNVRIESIKILKQIDILGKDPLVVMAETKERGFAGFGEFLSGWVSTIQSGGDVVNRGVAGMVRIARNRYLIACDLSD